MEKWAARNIRKFKKENSKVLSLGRNSPRHQYPLCSNHMDTKVNLN